MGTLEKILEEIEQAKKEPWYRLNGSNVKGRIDGAVDRIINIIRKHMNDGWIPVEERLPEDDHYILLSFTNFNLPMVGRYETDQEGGAFYLGDCDEEDTCISQDLFVNAWRPLPEPYRPGKEEGKAK